MVVGPRRALLGGRGGCAQSIAFIAREITAGSTPDVIHKNADTAFICGLVNTQSTAGGSLFSRFDLLLVFAAQNSVVALLNMANSTYTVTAANSPTFTVDRGFTGNSGTASLSTNFNPATAISPNFTQNNAHISGWNLTNGSSNVAQIVNGATIDIFPKYGDNNFYSRVNDSSAGLTISTPTGLLIGNRDSSTTRQAYQNGTSLGSYGTVSSVAVNNANFSALSSNNQQLAAMSAGASLSVTDQLNFYQLLRSRMTAVGVP